MIGSRYPWAAFALSFIAGGVDAIGYLVLFGIFTSHMSGNTVGMTVDVAQGHWAQAWRHFEPVAVFFAGVVAGIGLADLLQGRKVSRMFSIVAALEVALLVGFIFLTKGPAQLAVLLPAAAMGIQNALLRRAGAHNVRTTFITGMITNAAQGLVERNVRNFSFYGGIWVCFAAGGVIGAWIELSHGAVSTLFPVGCLAILIACDLFTPLAVPDTK